MVVVVVVIANRKMNIFISVLNERRTRGRD